MFSYVSNKLDAQLRIGQPCIARRHQHFRDNWKTEHIAKSPTRVYLEPNPEYHHAPRSYVENYIKYHQRRGATESSMHHRNPRYRWIDFRRRMVYGILDI
ncbi:hypothetical protein KR093_011187 [Drosophila rubida]|uniref:Uncharacterized protein n=1 Tax=Drosophila rubida TaxID=30044 RepID=A0AAD4PFR0_9MUSC|nr:hypothetical protein KR093_011187 [Drosophila rubida]